MDCSVDVKCLMDDVEDGLSMKLTDEKDCTDSIDCLPVCKNPNKLKNFNLITESKSCEQKTLNVRLKHLDQFLIADRKKNDVFKVVPANTCAVNKFVDVIRCPVCKVITVYLQCLFINELY